MSKASHQTVVVDKSYLRSASKEKIKELAGSHKLLICDPLTYEVSKDENKIRANLFAKLPTPGAEWEYIPSVSWLIRHEISFKKPCGRPSSHIKQRDYSIVKKLSDPLAELPPIIDATIKSYTKEAQDFQTILLQLISSEFERTPKQNAKKDFSQLVDGGINDESRINKFILNQREATLPVIESFPADSVTFRYFQVMLLYASDMRCRYEDFNTIESSTKAREKILHDVHDLQYLILALLEGKFATQERKLQKWWNVLNASENLFQI